ncbi:hypothetical protein DSO57_1000781 [Entomophthora muscae]|uniref:Uncharacterized protein n=1 Tax=Entomophthora muscae TaxID=34485 RepID=A0ACC2T952_9FUNG|nr:hypothetical protein DSO57_1000781 [Entomophthora muscae]
MPGFSQAKACPSETFPKQPHHWKFGNFLRQSFLSLGFVMPVDKMGKCRGFAFVEVTDEKGSIDVNELSELKIRGATLLVQEAVSELRLKEIHKVY